MEMRTSHCTMRRSGGGRHARRWVMVRALLVAGAAMAMGLAWPEPAAPQTDPESGKIRRTSRPAWRRETGTEGRPWIRGRSTTGQSPSAAPPRPDSSDAGSRRAGAGLPGGVGCLPLPVTTEAFAPGEGQQIACDLGIVAPATGLHPGRLRSGLAPRCWRATCRASSTSSVRHPGRGARAARDARRSARRTSAPAHRAAGNDPPPADGGAARYLLGTDLGVPVAPSCSGSSRAS
jgi:hypothetical protein